MRYLFGKDIQAFAILPPSEQTEDNVAALTNATGTVWDADTEGDQVTDLLDADGVTPRPDVETDLNGFLVPFYGPDGIASVWLDFGAGTRVLLVSSQAVAILGELLVSGIATSVAGVLADPETGDVPLTADDLSAPGVVSVVDGDEDRPAVGVVFWVGGTEPPANIEPGDVWLKDEEA